MRGLFVSLCGCEGSGKTTMGRLLSEYLEARGYLTLLTKEPGGTGCLIANRIRELLLDVAHTSMDPVTELLLYNASRRQHLQEIILPALQAGKIVITDRFSDSTRAYQGFGRGLNMGTIETLDVVSTTGLKPDLTLLFDVDVETGLGRNMDANKVDRLELEDLSFHKRVRAGFLELARAEPERIKVIDAGRSVKEVFGEAKALIERAILRRDLTGETCVPPTEVR